jgi:hypothetical protein
LPAGGATKVSFAARAALKAAFEPPKRRGIGMRWLLLPVEKLVLSNDRLRAETASLRCYLPANQATKSKPGDCTDFNGNAEMIGQTAAETEAKGEDRMNRIKRMNGINLQRYPVNPVLSRGYLRASVCVLALSRPKS